MKRWIIPIIVLVLIVGVYYQFFRPETTHEVESTSPDGMYRCRVMEKTRTGSSIAHIHLDRRDGDRWHEFSHKEDSNDSAVRAAYSVDWDFDEQHATRGVTVYGLVSLSSKPDVIFTWRSPEQANR